MMSRQRCAENAMSPGRRVEHRKPHRRGILKQKRVVAGVAVTDCLGRKLAQESPCQPGSARFSLPWWQLDIVGYAIYAPKAGGLFQKVNRPRKRPLSLRRFIMFQHKSPG
jgi:hypothetical protein